MFGKGVSLRAEPSMEIIRLKENKEELGEIERINSGVCVCFQRNPTEKDAQN